MLRAAVAGDAARDLRRRRSATGETYWSKYEDVYFAGDGARIDQDGDFWLLGRVDDVMNVSGHRISTIEVESALVDHQEVAEAAVCARADATHRPGDRRVRDAEGRRRRLGREARGAAQPRRAEDRRRSRSRRTSSSRPSCRRRAAARSCAACCATSPRTARSATRRRSPTRRSSRELQDRADCREDRGVAPCTLRGLEALCFTCEGCSSSRSSPHWLRRRAAHAAVRVAVTTVRGAGRRAGRASGVTGRAPRASVTLQVTMMDDLGKLWRSRLAVRADAHGVYDTDRDMRLFSVDAVRERRAAASADFSVSLGLTDVDIDVIRGGRVAGEAVFSRRGIAADGRSDRHDDCGAGLRRAVLCAAPWAPLRLRRSCRVGGSEGGYEPYPGPSSPHPTMPRSSTCTSRSRACRRR